MEPEETNKSDLFAVALFDVLGFENLVRSQGLESVTK
jgi:hypothetical protein